MTNTCKRTGTVWTHGGLTEARIARPVPRVPGSGRLRLLLVGGTRLGPLGCRDVAREPLTGENTDAGKVCRWCVAVVSSWLLGSGESQRELRNAQVCRGASKGK